MSKEKRLYIQSLTVEDFKSYKGLHRIGPLGTGFNAVVGPNGTGKSNIIDAVLFVLGFRAKKLRHARAEDLIHSGDPRPSKCTVTLHLEDKEKEKIEVGRTVSAKGKSTYVLNGAVVAQETIAETLTRYNIDLANNRFMILQGEIESISNMKPKGPGEAQGLVEYLEEIIGTQKYIEEIKKHETALEAAFEQAERQRAEYKFAEKEIEYLQPKAQAALTAISGYARHLQIRNDILKVEAVASKKKAEDLDGEIEKITAEKEKLRKSITGLSDSMLEAERALEAAAAKHRADQTAYFDAKRHFEAKDIEYRRKQDIQKKAEAEESALEKELTKKEEEKRAYKERMEQASTEIEENKQRIARETKEKTRVDKNLKKIEVPAAGMQKAHALKQQALLDHIKSSRYRKDTLRAKQRELAALTQKERQLKNILEEVPQEIERIKQETESYKKEKHEKVNSKLEALKKGTDETLAELQKRQDALSQLRSEHKHLLLSDRLAVLQSVKGYFGRVKDLCTIDKKYHIAVSAAARGALNNLVVDTTRTAEKCLDIIKDKGLGRHTILVLDRLVQAREKKDPNRLLDKIGTEFRSCFYHILGDTLVTENMDQAMARAFASDRPRVVTLDGKVIDRSGLMSGGFIRPVQFQKKKSSQALELEIEKAEQLVTEAKDGLEQLTRTLEKMEEKAAVLNLQKEKYEAAPWAIKALEQSAATAHAQSKGMEQHKERIKEIAQEVAEEAEALEALERQEKELEAEIKKSIEEIEEKLGGEYRDLKALSAGLFENISVLGKRNRQLENVLLQRAPSTVDVEEQLVSVRNILSQTVPVRPETEEVQLAEAEKSLRGSRIELEKLEEKKQEKNEEVQKARDQEVHLHTATETRQRERQREKHKQVSAEKNLAEINEKQRALRIKLGDCMEALDLSAAVEAQEDLLETNIDLFLTYKDKCQKLQHEQALLQGKEKEENEAKEALRGLKEIRTTQFTAGVKSINRDLKRIYSMLTFGGDAELEPVDYLDPFSEGVVMSVMPPRKSWKSISHLSGGERTLASLSLIFALHEYHPNSFYVMDEVDAALDYKNVGIVGKYISEKADDCQFLVISLRENMYELARTFVGVYRPADTTLTLIVQIPETQNRAAETEKAEGCVGIAEKGNR